eukprot:3670592-Prymnesium_polylepis.1
MQSRSPSGNHGEAHRDGGQLLERGHVRLKLVEGHIGLHKGDRVAALRLPLKPGQKPLQPARRGGKRG